MVVTIVVLLILAGISIVYVMGDNSIFHRTQQAKEEMNIEKSKEKLELVLLTEAKIEKHTNSQYNQEDFLDEMILTKIQGSEVIENVVIVDGYAFSIDRSVPKIGEYLGKKQNLIFPELEISKPILATDNKTASFTIIAGENQNGISKIEILQDGHVIDIYEYNGEKEEIQEIYTAKQNGKYVIRVYAKYSVSKVVEVTGIIPSIEFKPNGNEQYKKEHSTKIVVQETTDKVVSIRYQWTDSTKEPEESSFSDKEICKNGDIITKHQLTGTFYLWMLLTTQSGKTLIGRSEGFNFDNEGPTVVLTATPVSYSAFALNVTAQDRESGIMKYEFYVDETKKDTKEVESIRENNTQTLVLNNVAYGNHNCYVIVTDSLNHTTRKDITAQTLMDTTGPNITEFSATKYSETGITVSATAQDLGTGTVKFEFYVDNVLKNTQTCNATTQTVTKSYNITGLTTGTHNCMVKVYDQKNNYNSKTVSGTTKLYAWEKWSLNESTSYKINTSPDSSTIYNWGDDTPIYVASFDKSTGKFKSSNNSNWTTNYGKWTLTQYYDTYWMRYPGETSDYAYKYEGFNVDYATFQKYSSSIDKINYSKGSTRYTDVTSTSSSAYPASGRSGSYWYVKTQSK